MKKVALLMRDPILQRVCHAELTALGAEEPGIADTIETIPASTSLLLVDLDAYPPPSDPPFDAVIGISGADFLLPDAVRTACDAVLHRPISIQEFRAVLSPMLTETSVPLPKAPPTRRKIRSIIKKRPEPAENSLPLLDMASGRLRWQNHEVLLTPSESTVFSALLEHRGEAVSRAAITFLLGGDSKGNLSDVHICSIRKKLAPFGLDTYIQTVRGKGYRLIH